MGYKMINAGLSFLSNLSYPYIILPGIFLSFFPNMQPLPPAEQALRRARF